MGEPDFDDFIRQQKEKLIKERQALGDQNNNRQDGIAESRKKWQRSEDDLRVASNKSFYVSKGPAVQGNAEGDLHGNSHPSPVPTGSSKVQGTVADAVVTSEAPGGSAGGLFSGLGVYEKKRQALNHERKKEYNVLLNERKYQSPKVADATSSQENSELYEATLPGIRNKLSAEQEKIRQRNAEYNELLRAKPKAGSVGVQPPADDAERDATYLSTLPGLRDRLSAEQEKIRQRNAEYNEFLQQQQLRIQRQAPNRRDNALPPRPDRERASPSLLDDLVQGRPPVPGMNPRNKGWGTPTYDEILEAKRREELAYRRHDDPETKLGLPLTGKAYARNAGSENDISRGYVDGGLVHGNGSDNQRRVSFADQRLREPGGNDTRDHEPMQRRRPDQRGEAGKIAEPFVEAFAGGPADRFNSTLLVGREERPSAMQRKKDTYRQELIAQMEATALARKYEKQNELSVNATGLVDPIRTAPTFASQTPPPALKQQGQVQSYQQAQPDSGRLQQAPAASSRADPYGSDATAGLLDRGFAGIFNSNVPQQSPLDQAYSRLHSYPYGNPVVLPPPPPVVPLPTFTPSAITLPAAQYGGAPLQAAFPYGATNNYPQPLPQGFYTPTLNGVAPYAQQQPAGGQQLVNVPSQHIGFAGPLPQQQQQLQQQQLQQQPQQQQQSYGFPLKQPPKPSAPGIFSIGEERQKPAKVDYSAELQRQIEERKLAKQKEKEEQLRYELKLEAEIAAYNPYGRGGGGAPIKDTEGNTVADRRILKNAASDGLTPRIDIGVPKAVQAQPTTSNGESTQSSNLPAAGLDTPNDGQNYARGGHGLFGEPKSDAQKTASDKYKEELRVQIEEKKRKQEEEKRRAREEEEREAAHLEEDRLRLQREYEAEQQRAREKEEEARKRNEDLAKQAEEKRKDVEKKAQTLEENREKADQERRQRQQQTAAPPTGGRTSAALVPTQSAPTETPRTENAPAATTRLKSAEVLSQLAHMRRQLQQERLRVENALEKQKADLDSFDTSLESRTAGGIDAFEFARRRHGAPAAVRRPQLSRGITPAPLSRTPDDLDRLGTVPESPERSSSSHLESTSSFVLPVKPQSSNSLLEGDSSFIDATHGVGISYPDDFDELRGQDAVDTKDRRRAGRTTTPPSARSIDPDRITRKNQDRLKKLKLIAGDDMSVADPDDIIDRFMAQHHKPRPASGQTLHDESWLKAGSR